MAVLTANLNEAITAISVNLRINQPHSFQISFVSSSASYTLGSGVVIYRDGVAILNGIVTNYSYDAASKIMTVSGQDANSYNCQHDQSDTARTCSSDTLTTLQDALASVRSNAVASIDTNFQCYGYGAYTGPTHSMIERVCNAFGLNYYSNPTGDGYALTSGALQEPSSYTSVAGYNYRQGSDAESIISKIYIQKAITASQRRKIEVKNAAVSSTQTVRLVNPNHTAAASGDPQFPIDLFIDPWNKSFVTIDVPATGALYEVATDIGEAKQIAYVNCNDSLANPAWELEIWDADPGTSGTPNGNATLLGTISKGGIWTASGNETAAYVRVMRSIVNSGVSVRTYPSYDGVTVTAYVWDEAPNATSEAWSGSYESGDSGGRPDYNIISDDMYPNKALFDSQNLGRQIAKRDSLVMQRSFSVPGFLAASALSNYALPYDDNVYPLPITSINYQAAAGQESTALQGEW